MRRRVLCTSVVLAVAGLACLFAAPAPAQAPRGRTIAVTIDDLLYVSHGGAYLPAATQATTDILAALTRHKAPAIGFVNERQLDAGAERAARVAQLRRWKDAGMSLGNHTYSHVDFNTVSVEQFREEIVKGERTLDQLQPMRAGERRFFRHPMTHTGDTAEKKDAIATFLVDRGYTIAPHTIENNDFIFDVGLHKATVAGDTALAGRVRAEYLDYSMAATAFAEEISPKIFGREIPQVLLIHANALNAAALDELLRRFEARGYRFVTLEAAMTDPAYATRETAVSKFGPTWLFRWNLSLDLKLSFAADPDPPAWIMDLYNK